MLNVSIVYLNMILKINKNSEFEEPEEPNSRSFFSEIIGTISDVKFSHSGRYLLSRDYLTVKVWDLHMENKPIMSMQVIFDPFIMIDPLEFLGSSLPHIKTMQLIRK